MIIGIALKNIKNVYLAKMNYVIHWLMINHTIVYKSYDHILNFWEPFKMNTVKSNLYLNVDVLLLTCVFETFRKESINYFELDPAH